MIRPTVENLKKWDLYEQKKAIKKTMQFFIDFLNSCTDVCYVELSKGQTLLLPGGYLHAVFSPEDAIAFGGNFLCDFGIEAQFR